MKKISFIALVILLTFIGMFGCDSQNNLSGGPSSTALPSGISDTTNIPTEPATTSSSPSPTEIVTSTATDLGYTYEDTFFGVRLVDKTGSSLQEWDSDSFVMFQPIKVEQLKDEQMLAYSSDSTQPEILLEEGDRTSLAAPKWSNEEISYGNDYGIDILYGDRLLNDEIFVVKGNRTLYLVNIKSGESSKLYSSKLPIYGIAASPDNSRVALLVASDPNITPDADLIVLNRKGKEVYSKQKASYYSHSDGFLFVYPFVWIDEHNISVPLYGNSKYGNGGQDEINVDANKIFFREKSVPPKEALALLEQHIGKVDFPEELRFLPEPKNNSPYYAVETNNKDIWMLNTDSNQAIKISEGKLLKWTKDGNILLAKTKPEAPFYFIGVDNLYGVSINR